MTEQRSAGVRLAARLKRIQLDGEYAGVWIDFHQNPAMGVFDDMTSGDPALVRAALAKVVRFTNLEDESGKAIDLHTPEGWREVPPDFWMLIADRLKDEFAIPKASSTDSTTGSSGATPEESHVTGTA